MTGIILNVTADGTWQTLAQLLEFPRGTFVVTIQTRDYQEEMYFKYVGRDEFITIKYDTALTIQGKFLPGDIQIQATAGVIVEILISTQLVTLL